MKQLLLLRPLLGIAALVSAIAAPSAFAKSNLSGKLTLTGSSAIAPLAGELAKKFEELHPDVRIDVQSGGSSRGITDVRQALADIGMISRGLNEKEKDLQSHTIALDGIGIILNSANPVQALTKDQIVEIYKGKTTNWLDVGGTDARITVVNKAEGRSTLELFLVYTNLKTTDVKAQIIIGDNEQGIKTVAGNKDAIGYVSVGSAKYSAASGVKIKLLAAGKVPASTTNIKNGSYELSRPLNFVTKPSPTGLALAFIEFAKSEKVHDVIKSQYLIPKTASATD